MDKPRVKRNVKRNVNRNANRNAIFRIVPIPNIAIFR